MFAVTLHKATWSEASKRLSLPEDAPVVALYEAWPPFSQLAAFSVDLLPVLAIHE